MQIKLLAVFAFVLLFLIVILLRIVFINVENGDLYAKEVLSQENYDSQTLYSRRGDIVDANGRTLAYCEKVYNLVLDCYAVNEDEKKAKEYADATIRALTTLFGLDGDELRELLTSEKTKNSQYQILRQMMTEEDKEAYTAYMHSYDDDSLDDEARKERYREIQKVKGIWFEDQYIRKYPLDSLASNVVGFSNSEGGVVGLEAYYDDQLKGTNGRVFGYLNENQEYQRKTIAPQNGNTLQTTIDINVQQIVEKYIAEFDETYGEDHDDGTAKHGAKNIGVIIMDPNSGAILAMATNSGFDLNNPTDLSAWHTESEVKSMNEPKHVEALYDMWGNFCISDGIEPGSTFKPITVSSALECGAVTPNDHFYCDGGEFITDTEIHCDAYPNAHGDESLGDVLKNSCNDGLMQIGMKMTVPRFIQYQNLFNFGRPTGIDLPNEGAGSVYTRDTMNEVELATCTFGQGLTCTMIQEITAFSAVINGGYYYQPHVVDKILDENGKVIKSSGSLLLKQTISNDVSEIMRGYLEVAVQEGTGRHAQVPGYRIGGKTGTAEKIDPDTGMRAKGKYLVSFIGAAPINDPEVLIYVVVDEPNVPDQANSTFAQEIYRKIAMEALPYLGVYPTESVTDADLAAMGLSREDVADDIVQIFDAIDSYGNYHTDARVEDGKIVDSNGNEIAGAYIAEDGTVYDAVMNKVSFVKKTEEPENIDPKVDNPGLALPPAENEGAADQATIWDGTATNEEEEEQE